MLSFLTANWGTIIIGIIVLIVVMAVVFKMRKSKKKGETSCGCGCTDCPSSQACNKGKK